MPPTSLRTPPLRALAACATVAAALAVGAGLPAPGSADVAADREAAKSLRQQVAAETARIETTGAGLADAEQRLSMFEARADAQQARLKATQDALIRARFRLARLERKARVATKTLSKNLVAAYQTGTPDIVSVVLDAKGFSELLEEVDFYKKVSRNNGQILDDTRQAKQAVALQTTRLSATRRRFTVLAAAAVADRNKAAVIHSAILSRQQAQLEKRSGTQAKLGEIKGRIRKVQRQQAAQARAAASANTATQAAPPTSGSANSVVDRVIAAANDIASTPYVWGGGHGGGQDSGYDCSGSVSFALAGGGLLSTPLDSTGFMSWGEAGPGKRITVYANSGHAFMYVDGRRFDTSNLSGGGTRWSSELRDTSGFVARHPAGY
jgi:cell wall-associated NlpC family hydrolase